MNTAEQFNIGEAAARSGVSAKMARHHESLGLLPAVLRTESGYRRYGEKEVHTLRFIRRARDLGFGMLEIAELLKLPGRSRPSGALRRVTHANPTATHPSSPTYDLMVAATTRERCWRNDLRAGAVPVCTTVAPQANDKI